MNILQMLGLGKGLGVTKQPSQSQNPFEGLRASIMGAAQQSQPSNPALTDVEPDVPHADGGEVPAYAPYDHRGMFGLRGTGRDILGAIGDAFLVQAGRDPVYRPQRNIEQEADAMQGFAENPLHAIEALSRRNPAASREMYDDYAQREVQRSVAERQAADLRFRQENTIRDRAVRALFAATEETYPTILPQIRRMLERNGVQLDFDLPETWDAAQVEVLRRSGIDPDDQARMDDTRQYRRDLIDVQRGNLGVRRQSENRQERQGNRRLDQGDARVRQGDQRVRQGQERLRQGAESLEIRRANGRRTGRRGASGNRNVVVNPDGTVSIRR